MAADPAPAASVIVVARDRKDELAAALDSLAAQGEPFEVIVVDDGSSDGTAAMLAEQHRLELRFMAVLGDVENRRMDPALAATTLRREVIAQYGGVTGAWLATQEPGDDPRSQQWMEAWKERAAANERWIITTAEWLEAPGDASLATRQSAERRAAQASARFHQIDGAPR